MNNDKFPQVKIDYFLTLPSAPDAVYPSGQQGLTYYLFK